MHLNLVNVAPVFRSEDEQVPSGQEEAGHRKDTAVAGHPRLFALERGDRAMGRPVEALARRQQQQKQQQLQDVEWPKRRNQHQVLFVTT